MVVAIIARAVAYGFPALLIVLGFIAYTGGKFAELIFGTSEGTVIMGVGLIILGVLIYVAELFFGVR